MKIEGVEFREALEMLAERAGIVLEKPPAAAIPAGGTASKLAHRLMTCSMKPPRAPARRERRSRPAGGTYSTSGRCCKRWPGPKSSTTLPAGNARGRAGAAISAAAGHHRRKHRAVPSRLLAAGARLDSAAGRRRRRGRKRRRRAKLLEAIGVLARPADGGSYYDRFRGRLLFSIHDVQGRPVGIGGRVLPELGLTSPAKYVNSPETPLFTKSKLLYGLDLAREPLRKTKPRRRW